MSLRRKKIISIVLVFLFCISPFSVTDYNKVNAQDNVPVNMKEYAENDRLILYVNEQSADFALYDKEKQNLWHSTPANKEDKLAKGLNKTGLYSQLSVTFFDTEKKSLSSRNTYVDSVKKKTFTIDKIKNGFKVTYSFKDKDVELPMYITLGKENLLVDIPIKEIKEEGLFQVYEIGVLPYFGAGGIDDDGYMFVPDGSGSLINFNNGKQMYNQYSADIYGADPVFTPEIKIVKKQDIKLPVFGLKNGKNGFIGVIDKGAPAGKIFAGVSKKIHSFNYVYPKFILRKSDVYEVDDFNGQKRKITQWEKGETKLDDIQVKYYPLESQDVSYVDMANKYKNYLIEDKGLKYNDDIKSSLYIDLYAAVKKKKPILGIPFYVTQELATFDEVKNMLNDLNKLGIDCINVKYNNVFKNEINYELPNKIRFESKLGGERGFNKLVNETKANGVNIFPTINMTKYRKSGKLFGGNSLYSKKITGVPSKQFYYSTETYEQDEDFLKSWYLLNPNCIAKYTDKVIDKIKHYNIDNISLQSLPNSIYSNYGNDFIGRDTSLSIWNDSLSNIKNNVEKMMTNCSNDYALPYSDYVMNIPVESSKYIIEDKDVPFYQIVLSGLMSYSTPSANLSAEPDVMFLKAMETGSMINFSWITRDVEVLQDTELNYLYSANYNSWKDTALDYYKKIKEVYDKSGNHVIVEHRELSDKVFETEYENGLKVIVNYSERPIKIKDITVDSMNYAFKGGK